MFNRHCVASFIRNHMKESNIKFWMRLCRLSEIHDNDNPSLLIALRVWTLSISFDDISTKEKNHHLVGHLSPPSHFTFGFCAIPSAATQCHIWHSITINIFTIRFEIITKSRLDSPDEFIWRTCAVEYLSGTHDELGRHGRANSPETAKPDDLFTIIASQDLRLSMVIVYHLTKAFLSADDSSESSAPGCARSLRQVQNIAIAS
jgi:hypothetical protein